MSDASYDVVLAGNVLEHVPRVWVWIKELGRVCKPGGVVITVNPLSWPYHEAPVDCWRVYPEGMKALYEEAGLEVLHCSFESLESKWHRRSIPFMTFDEYLARRPWPVRVAYKVATRLGFPD
ncbi:MAG: methyltransferase domain-containing protein, partial [Gemmataceae bacterium]